MCGFSVDDNVEYVAWVSEIVQARWLFSHSDSRFLAQQYQSTGNGTP